MTSDTKQDFYSSIVRAQQYDCQSDYGKAFVHYLDGINGLTNYLKTEAIDKLWTIGTKDIDYKLVSGVNTLNNCIERLQIITNYFNNNNSIESNQTNDDLVSKLSQQSINGSVSDRRQSNGSNSLSIESNSLQSIESKSSTNLQKAYKENAFLSKIFETRLRQTTDSSKRASLKLELQRRITENIELAKNKDKEVYHSMHLRQRKSLELAAKKLLQQQNVLNLDNESMFVDNQSQQQLYAQILDFESKHLDLSQQFRCLNLSPNETEVNQLIVKILDCKDHPLTQWIHKFQTQIVYIITPLLKKYLKKRSIAQNSTETDVQTPQTLQSLNSTDILEDLDVVISDVESEALVRHFQNIANDISLSHETITLMLTLILFDNHLYYKPSNYELFREQHFALHSIVSQFIYPHIWSAFKYLFRIAFNRHEIELKKGIKELLISNEFVKDFTDNYDQNMIEESVDSLKALIEMQSPFEKLKAMVRLTQRLCLQLKSTSDHSSDVSADDLVPALCHVVLRSGLHQLISECFAIELLVDQKYLLGEEGYCLSSILTALKYIQIHCKPQNSDNIS